MVFSPRLHQVCIKAEKRPRRRLNGMLHFLKNVWSKRKEGNVTFFPLHDIIWGGVVEKSIVINHFIL